MKHDIASRRVALSLPARAIGWVGMDLTICSPLSLTVSCYCRKYWLVLLRYDIVRYR
jgi:hypothetical protein